jgi:hypothetical protein
VPKDRPVRRVKQLADAALPGWCRRPESVLYTGFLFCLEWLGTPGRRGEQLFLVVTRNDHAWAREIALTAKQYARSLFFSGTERTQTLSSIRRFKLGWPLASVCARVLEIPAACWREYCALRSLCQTRRSFVVRQFSSRTMCFTGGRTLNEVAHHLILSGAREVSGVTLARATFRGRRTGRCL